jgi:hypothetical protein
VLPLPIPPHTLARTSSPHIGPDESATRTDISGRPTDGGAFIVTFRDYSLALIGEKRFIPVRSDADRMLTCFLEYDDDAVTVHDIPHERDGTAWQQRVSAYSMRPSYRIPAFPGT